MQPTILIVVPDLMFQPRIADAARGLGATVRIADSEAATESALSDAPAAVVVDLHAAGIDTVDVIRRASGAGARVLAFGRHTEPATLRAARDAGAETVVPRSQLVEELPALLGRLLAPRKARA
jgi:CheY-like chemotaxis protein